MKKGQKRKEKKKGTRKPLSFFLFKKDFGLLLSFTPACTQQRTHPSMMKEDQRMKKR
jgi:hypothetical protein